MYNSTGTIWYMEHKCLNRISVVWKLAGQLNLIKSTGFRLPGSKASIFYHSQCVLGHVVISATTPISIDREGLREGCTGTRQGFKVNQFAKKTVCEKVVSMGGHKEGFDCNTANVVVCLFVLIYSYVFLVSLCLPSCWILNQDVTLHSSHCP